MTDHVDGALCLVRGFRQFPQRDNGSDVLHTETVAICRCWRHAPDRGCQGSATCAPSEASPSAIASPIPRLAPVTIARLPVSCRSTSSLLKRSSADAHPAPLRAGVIDTRSAGAS